MLGFDGAALNRVASNTQAVQAVPGAARPQNYYVPKEYDPNTQKDPLVKPVGG